MDVVLNHLIAQKSDIGALSFEHSLSLWSEAGMRNILTPEDLLATRLSAFASNAIPWHETTFDVVDRLMSIARPKHFAEKAVTIWLDTHFSAAPTARNDFAMLRMLRTKSEGESSTNGTDAADAEPRKSNRKLRSVAVDRDTASIALFID